MPNRGKRSLATEVYLFSSSWSATTAREKRRRKGPSSPRI